MKEGIPISVAEKNTKVACWFTAYNKSLNSIFWGKIQIGQKVTITQMKSMVGQGFAVHMQDSCALGTGLQPGTPSALPN